MASVPAQWPALPYGEWAETKKTVHLYSQLLGKTRLALEPPQAQWLGACLYVRARGLTTGPMPWGSVAVEVTLDFVAHELAVETSDGRREALPLLPAKPVAEVDAWLLAAYRNLGIDVDMWDRPQEVADLTPLTSDTVHATYDADAVTRWWTVMSAVRNVFDEWRSPFGGRSGIQFWWGAFDLAVLRFNGKKATPPQDRGYIMRYDLDAEFMNAGFWPGDDSSPEPVLYAYIHPKPEGCELVPIDAKGAAWIEQMGEWVLPYSAALASGDPRRAILDFLDCVYAIAGSHGGWDLASFEYTKPATPKRA